MRTAIKYGIAIIAGYILIRNPGLIADAGKAIEHFLEKLNKT